MTTQGKEQMSWKENWKKALLKSSAGIFGTKKEVLLVDMAEKVGLFSCALFRKAECCGKSFLLENTGKP